jgi:small subunit ribosomal protein S16
LAVSIRLTRVGATKRPSYRVVAIDRRRPRDGRALEILGFYDPLTEPATVRLETEKIKAWIGKGAQPSDMVTRLMRQAEAAAAAPESAAPKKPASRGRSATRKPKAAPKAAATVAEAPEAGTDEAAASDEAAAGADASEAAPASDPEAEAATPEADAPEAAPRDDA